MQIRKLFKSFWKGVKDAFAMLELLVLGVASIVLIAMALAIIVSGCVVAAECCGLWGVIFFGIDIVLLSIICHEVSQYRFSGNCFVQLLKCLGLMAAFFILLGLANALLWFLGSIILLIWGATLTIGATMAVGLAALIVLVMLLLLVIYIRDCGWPKTAELLSRILGIAVIAALVVLLLCWIF